MTFILLLKKIKSIYYNNMLVNILVIIFLVFFIVLLINLFLGNNYVEGYMAVIGPMIKPQISSEFTPHNRFYPNFKLTQDFDPDSVTTFYS
jgi:hypothetical protein